MSRSAGHIRFTVEERILLHLLDFTRYRNKIEVPIAITQQGISQCIRIERKHIPRSLKAMHEKNLLVERTTHVKNKPQRMKTYYLTLNGEAKASELKEGIMDFTIRIKDEKGKIKEKTISEVEKLLQGLYTLAEVLSCVLHEGVFNIKQSQVTEEKVKDQLSLNKIKIYQDALQQAWKDGKMTSDERDLLRNLRVSLDISEKKHVQLEEEILENATTSTNTTAREVYKVALEQALADKKISADERAILEKIKKHFSIKDK
jgi:hypothetical protein